MSLLSQANDGGNAGIWRILDIFQRNDVTATIDVNGLAVQKWPECIKALHEQGSQITGHGTTNDLKLTELTPDQQRDEIRPVSHIIREVTGSVPVGWVSPGSLCRSRRAWCLTPYGACLRKDDPILQGA